MTNKTKYDFTDVHNSFDTLLNGLLLVAAQRGKGNEALAVIEVFRNEIEAPFSKLYDFMEELKDAKQD